MISDRFSKGTINSIVDVNVTFFILFSAELCHSGDKSKRAADEIARGLSNDLKVTINLFWEVSVQSGVDHFSHIFKQGTVQRFGIWKSATNVQHGHRVARSTSQFKYVFGLERVV